MKNKLRRFTVGVLLLALAGFMPSFARAAVSNWQTAVTISSRWDTDFTSDSFKQSVRNAAADHANMITLSFPWYQSNLYSTDIQAGGQTPTDAALASGIDYVHSLGLAVTLKPHLESYTGQWRAYINPSDRDTWFANYGNMLNHLGSIGQQHHVEMIVVGSELINMSSQYTNSTNTQHWKTLIANLRQIYSGKLTYSANWGESGFVEEKNQVAFWSDLDYLGTNGYYELRTDSTDYASIAGWWQNWENNQIAPWRAANGYKPVVFTEVGYKSVSGAQWRPWDYSIGGGADQTTQANLYNDFFQYWNSKDYVVGAHIWDWSSDPNAGGAGNTDYTPQHKQAEGVMSQWFSGSTSGTPPSPTPTPGSVTCPGPAANAFSGCYFNDRTLTNPVFTRNDSSINFDWGMGSPDPAVPQDNFSARWQGNFDFSAGTYTFTATADDGIRVFVDGSPVIDQWKDQPATTYTATKALTAGTHAIKVEYYENGGNAVAKVNWSQGGGSTPGSSSCPGAANGSFTACYYNGRNFDNFVTSRNETSINNDWGTGSPIAGVGNDNFSVSWEGNFNFNAGDYQFTATGDDGIRVLVDGVPVIDHWVDQPPTTYTVTKTMTAGTHNIKVLYYENGGGAVAKVSWSQGGGSTTPPPSGGGSTIVYVNGYPTVNGNYIDCYGNIDNDPGHHTTNQYDTDPAHHVGQNCPKGSFVNP